MEEQQCHGVLASYVSLDNNVVKLTDHHGVRTTLTILVRRTLCTVPYAGPH